MSGPSRQHYLLSCFYSTARFVLLPAPKLRVPSRAALDASCAVASRASRLSVSERCCTSSCCACQIEPSYSGIQYMSLHSDAQARTPPIHSASTLPPTPLSLLPAPHSISP